MKQIKMNGVGFSTEQVASMTEKDFIDSHVKAGVYGGFPRKEQIELLQSVHKKSTDATKKKP